MAAQGQSQLDVSKATTLEFKVREEPWTKYKLEDGTFLFARLLVTKIYRSDLFDNSGQPVYFWSSQNLVTTLSPRELKGTPSNPPPISTNPADFSSVPVDFERVGNELWNVYDLTDGSMVRIKLELVSVVRTDKHAADGEPYYIVSSQLI